LSEAAASEQAHRAQALHPPAWRRHARNSKLAVERTTVISMPSMVPRLYLVRHGETEWSLSGRHTGRTDIPLTEQGEQDARRLGDRLRTTTCVRVFTSPMQRAQRTCALAGLTSVAEVEPDLAEWNYGDYEGLR